MSNKIYVGNLSFKASESDLAEYFSPYGEVLEARIITDRDTKRSRGFAFVTFSDASSVSGAIDATHNQPFLERSLIVNEAKEKNDRN
jgi:cold-inducible RNA-binding protein